MPNASSIIPRFTKEQLTHHFDYLDKLRASGATNMLAAASFLRHAHGLDHNTSHKVFSLWAETFDDTSIDNRVEKALQKGI